MPRQALTLLAEDGEGPQFKSGPAHHLQPLYQRADSMSPALEQKPARLFAVPDCSWFRVRALPPVFHRPAAAHPCTSLAFAGPGQEIAAAIAAAVPAAKACDPHPAFVQAAPGGSDVQGGACFAPCSNDDLHVEFALTGTIAATLVRASAFPLANVPLTVYHGNRTSAGKGAPGAQARRAG